MLGFGVLRFAQHKEREGAGAAYLEDALVAGKGLGRRSPRRRRQGRKIPSKGGDQEKQRGGDEPAEALSGRRGQLSTSRARA